MGIDHTLVQTWPLLTANIVGHTAAVGVDGQEQRYTAINTDELREQVLSRAVEVARTVERPVRIQIRDDQTGTIHLVVAPNGETELATNDATPVDGQERTAIRQRPTSPPPPPPHQPPNASLVPVPPTTPAQPGTHAAPPAPMPPTGPGERSSFITTGRSVLPAEQGWRGRLNRVGLHVKPSSSEEAYRADVAAVRRRRSGTRTIMVANSKGSASKTPTCVCLSCVFARLMGGNVVLYDNNETEGTARFRCEEADHQASILHLLEDHERLMDPQTHFATINNYVHNQPADKYDLLWSDPTLDGDYVANDVDVRTAHRVLSRYYRLVVFDTGNNHRAPNWRAAAALTDALVVPCTEVEDTAENGARILETMHKRGGHEAELAANALVVVSQRTPDGADLDRIHAKWETDIANGLARAVVKIPYDPALKSGVIRWDACRPKTKRAWLRAAAVIAETL